MPLVPYKSVLTYFPLRHAQDTGDLSPYADLETIKAICPELFSVIELLNKDPCIGRVGNYIGVYEIAKGIESYIPGSGAQPQHGERDVRSSVATLAFKTFAKAPKDVLDEFIEKLVQKHPWEHPVIEVAEIELWESDTQSGSS